MSTSTQPPYVALRPPKGKRKDFYSGLRPIPEVRRLWNERSGENLSKARVWQIICVAHRKLRTELTRNP